MGKITWYVHYQRANGDIEDQVGRKDGSVEEVPNLPESQRGPIEITKRQRRDLEHEENFKFVENGDSEKFFDSYLHEFSRENVDKYRLKARLTVDKDDVQAVLPICKVFTVGCPILYQVFRVFLSFPFHSNQS